MKIKRFIAALICGVMMLAAIPAMAADDVKVFIDGTRLYFDVEPIVIDGYTMVPMRAIFEKLGAAVRWDNETQTVYAYKNALTIQLTVGEKTLIVSNTGEETITQYTLAVPAMIFNDRAFIPLRAVSEALGVRVEWDSKNNYVLMRDPNYYDNSLYDIAKTDEQYPYYGGASGVPNYSYVTGSKIMSIWHMPSLIRPVVGFTHMYPYNSEDINTYIETLQNEGFVQIPDIFEPSAGITLYGTYTNGFKIVEVCSVINYGGYEVDVVEVTLYQAY